MDWNVERKNKRQVKRLVWWSKYKMMMAWNKGKDCRQKEMEEMEGENIQNYQDNDGLNPWGKGNWATGNYSQFSGLCNCVADHSSEIQEMVNEEISGMGQNT